MQKLIIVALIASAVLGSNVLLTDHFVASINSKQTQWKATSNNMFSGMTREQIKSYLGTQIQDYEDTVDEVTYSSLLNDVELPPTFDSREQWPQCIHEIRNQAHCGSCWAFGASEALSDRVCIATNGQENHVLSPQWMVSCDKLNLGCNGGILPVAWFYLWRHGIPAEECLPYTSSEGVRGQCPKTCVDGSAPRFFKIKSIRTFRSAQDAKLDILTNGPIETGFMVYEDFMAYDSGVYTQTEGSLLGGHAVKVIGWGQENGVKYWIAANSWSEKWGENGFFRIQEGQCGFDKQFIAGSVRL